MLIADLYELDVKNPMRIMPGGDDLRHVVYGLALYLALCLLPRQRVGSVAPLLGLAVLECLNETADRLHYGSWRWPDTSGDIVNTLAIPLALVVAERLSRDTRLRYPALLRSLAVAVAPVMPSIRFAGAAKVRRRDDPACGGRPS